MNRWIIFCRVVDYFGDVGFCWRLACALKQLGIPEVILVVDRFSVLDDIRGSSRPPGVLALPWNVTEIAWLKSGVPNHHLADVVIEAFACNPPEHYLRALSKNTRWFTLDYLATEPWADDAHLKPSPHPRLGELFSASRRWFTPGFSSKTGGLLHGNWKHISEDRRRAWRTKLVGQKATDNVFLVLAFGYENAPFGELESLLEHDLPAGFQSYAVWKPKGIEYSQEEFDQILQACDLNFVRGEDSFVRAHWAQASPWAVPFVWQAYRQENNAHGHKLAGWLNQLVADPALLPLQNLHWAWNGIAPVDYQAPVSLALVWREFTTRYQDIRLAMYRHCGRLARRKSLEERLFLAGRIK